MTFLIYLNFVPFNFIVFQYEILTLSAEKVRQSQKVNVVPVWLNSITSLIKIRG